MLRQLLIGPLRFKPRNEERRRGYVFEGLIALDRLLAGVLELPTKVASPGGTADGWPMPLAGSSIGERRETARPCPRLHFPTTSDPPAIGRG